MTTPLASNASRIEELQSRVSILLSEIERKNKILENSPKPSKLKADSIGPIELLKIMVEKSKTDWFSRRRANGATLIALEENSEISSVYPVFRELLMRLHPDMQQQSRKLVLGAVATMTDARARQELENAAMRPLEPMITALCAAADSNGTTFRLKSICWAKAKELCESVGKLMDNMEDEKTAPVLCGVVEQVCESLNQLPVSSFAALKRQVLECAKTCADSCREFKELAESGKLDWTEDLDFGDDEDEDDGDDSLDEISSEDAQRLMHSSDAFEACKVFLKHVADDIVPTQNVQWMENVSDCIDRLSTKANDFGTELYPPHDVPRVIQKATAFLEAATELLVMTLEGSKTKETKSYEDFKLKLSMIVV